MVTILKHNNYAVDTNTAKAYASDVLKVDKEKGFKNNYKFIDCTRDLNTFHKFLNTSIVVSTIGIVVVLILVVVFSLVITRLVVENYQKQFITDASHKLKPH